MTRAATLQDLNGDGVADLVAVTATRLLIKEGLANGTFGPSVFELAVRAGVWVTVGDVDGRWGSDLFVIQSCFNGSNLDDLLLLHGPGEWAYSAVKAPPASGCGDVAAAIDLNDDGRDELIVLNGHPGGPAGPVQVLTTSWFTRSPDETSRPCSTGTPALRRGRCRCSPW